MDEQAEVKRWFIKLVNGKYEVRYIVCIIRNNIEYDNQTNSLVVHMENSYNPPDSINSTLEEVCIKDVFATKEVAQMEIIRRERFEPIKN